MTINNWHGWLDSFYLPACGYEGKKYSRDQQNCQQAQQNSLNYTSDETENDPNDCLTSTSCKVPFGLEGKDGQNQSYPSSCPNCHQDCINIIGACNHSKHESFSNCGSNKKLLIHVKHDELTGEYKQANEVPRGLPPNSRTTSQGNDTCKCSSNTDPQKPHIVWIIDIT